MLWIHWLCTDLGLSCEPGIQCQPENSHGHFFWGGGDLLPHGLLGQLSMSFMKVDELYGTWCSTPATGHHSQAYQSPKHIPQAYQSPSKGITGQDPDHSGACAHEVIRVPIPLDPLPQQWPSSPHRNGHSHMAWLQDLRCDRAVEHSCSLLVHAILFHHGCHSCKDCSHDHATMDHCLVGQSTVEFWHTIH